MFEILKDKTICLTRGDVANIVFAPKLKSSGEPYTFKKDDVIRFTVMKKNDCANVVIQKDIIIEAETDTAIITLVSEDTRIDKPINNYVDYWYEIELNPDTEPQTLIGFDKAGAKIFRLFPEGGGGVEELYFPITGLYAGRTYTIVFDETYNGTFIQDTYRYGCGIIQKSAYDSMTKPSTQAAPSWIAWHTGSTGKQSGSITFTANANTVYWAWSMGRLSDGKEVTITMNARVF